MILDGLLGGFGDGGMTDERERPMVFVELPIWKKQAKNA